MLSLPADIVDTIICELLARKDKVTVKFLSLVHSSLAPLCQKHLLSHLTISCSKADINSARHRRSSDATQELLQSSPHLVSNVRSLSILDSGSSWTQIDHALLFILQSLSNLTCFTWSVSSFSLHPTRWNELPHSLQDAIRLVIRRPSLTSLSLHFADLTNLLNKTIVISPSLTHLRLRSTGYSNITLELTRPSIIPCDENGEAILPQLLVTACKLEWIEEREMLFGWMSAVRPNLDFERLHKLAVLRCALVSTSSELPWGPLLYHEYAQAKLEELWFDIVSTRGPPAGVVMLDRLPSLRRLGITAVLSGPDDATNLIAGLAQFFEVSNTTNITHLAFGFSFHTTSLVLSPLKVPWWRFDTAVAILPTLQWVGIQVIDCRSETAIIVPENPEIMLPTLSEKGVLHWSTSGLQFPVV